MAIYGFIRFQDSDGQTHYGEVTQQQLSAELHGASVKVLSGDPFSGFRSSGNERIVDKVLCPIESTPIVIGIGLNYRQHAEESKSTIAAYPVLFMKPADAITGPYDPVYVHPDAQSHLDYEGEFTVIIGRDAKNVSVDDALSYVLGYTNGNDVSARNFQMPPNSGGQFCYAKSFDGFAPIGPAVVLSSAVPDPQQLEYTTKVNDELRQSTGTDDMIWNVRQIIQHLSRGTTLRKGTVIMTGTPSGVGFFMEPKGFLKDGDTVEIETEGFGKLANKMVFEK